MSPLNMKGQFKHQYASQVVVDKIREAIQSGELKVGDQIPNEAMLAQQLGVGRSSLREGMRILDAFGIVEIRQGEGTFVTNNYAEQVFDFLGFFPNKENLRYLIQLRRVMEVGCIKVIYHSFSMQEFEHMDKLVQTLCDCEITNLHNNIAADAQFHELLISKTGNPLIAQIYRMMSKMMSTLLEQLMCYPEVVQDAYKSHREILNALKKEDLTAAIRAIDAHLSNVEKYAEKYLPDDIL